MPGSTHRHHDAGVGVLAALLTALALLGSLLTTGTPAGAQACCEVQRVGDADPVQLGVNMSQLVLADGTPGDYAIMATATDFADALLGGSLTFGRAPVLLTDPVSLDDRNVAELRRLQVDDVVLLGGTAAVSQQVADDLSAEGFGVLRLAGASRFETAYEVALAVEGVRALLDQSRWPARRTMAFATGSNFADALTSAQMSAHLGYPTLLSLSDELPSDTRGFMEDNRDTFDRAFAWGGEAVLSQAFIDDLREVYDGRGFRVFGPGREETALEIGQALHRELLDAFPDDLARQQVRTGVVINARASFQPALVSALVASSEPAVFLPVLGDGSAIHPATAAYLCNPDLQAPYAGIQRLVVPETVGNASPDAVQQVVDRLNGIGC